MRAFHKMRIETQPDGSAAVYHHTNDDDDDGRDDGVDSCWFATYDSVDKALKACGSNRVGLSGVVVTVTLDGEEVE